MRLLQVPACEWREEESALFAALGRRGVEQSLAFCPMNILVCIQRKFACKPRLAHEARASTGQPGSEEHDSLGERKLHGKH